MYTNKLSPKRNPAAVRSSARSEKLEKLLTRTYRKDQILVFFKRKPTDNDILTVKESFKKDGIAIETIKVLSCGNCDIPVQLWTAKGIHSRISKDSLKAGSGPSSTTVGESYSLNFTNSVPADAQSSFQGKKGDLQKPSGGKKEEIIVAVLDTGVDIALVDPGYLWKQTDAIPGLKCYANVREGWNFVGNTSNYTDDNPNKHGSIVSQYIINQFAGAENKTVKIMPLKTHDKDGVGDLFGILCAINFAIAKGAHIINASWGFYYYYEIPVPYLKTLITAVLRKKGILFVTAAGNQSPADDEIAKQIYQAEHGITLTEDQLRNLAIHNFYPANLSTATNSVITVTTTDEHSVSATQNYSNKYVDLGVVADQVLREGMKFAIPFEGADPALISGSSFATAIASGIIGAHCPTSLYRPNIKKADFLACLGSLPVSGSSGTHVLEENLVLAKKYIRNGAYVK
ncbi:S8 family serine peptidase [Pedobacter frigoris]|uniref:S8 family serine peptidase n=1 Tax=Pedobacter frigoris TaxID=2571272 RepID=UPI0029302E05|nr:S8 family serine peptidase [Pedobacter frigoris]